MRQAFEAGDTKASGRIRIGIYTYYEDGAADGAMSPGAPTQSSGDHA